MATKTTSKTSKKTAPKINPKVVEVIPDFMNFKQAQEFFYHQTGRDEAVLKSLKYKPVGKDHKGRNIYEAPLEFFINAGDQNYRKDDVTKGHMTEYGVDFGSVSLSNAQNKMFENIKLTGWDDTPLYVRIGSEAAGEYYGTDKVKDMKGFVPLFILEGSTRHIFHGKMGTKMVRFVVLPADSDINSVCREFGNKGNNVPLDKDQYRRQLIDRIETARKKNPTASNVKLCELVGLPVDQEVLVGQILKRLEWFNLCPALLDDLDKIAETTLDKIAKTVRGKFTTATDTELKRVGNSLVKAINILVVRGEISNKKGFSNKAIITQMLRGGGEDNAYLVNAFTDSKAKKAYLESIEPKPKKEEEEKIVTSRQNTPTETVVEEPKDTPNPNNIVDSDLPTGDTIYHQTSPTSTDSPAIHVPKDQVVVRAMGLSEITEIMTQKLGGGKKDHFEVVIDLALEVAQLTLIEGLPPSEAFLRAVKETAEHSAGIYDTLRRVMNFDDAIIEGLQK